ncbi:GntR family transcriptional regulator [Methylobacterium sp. J-076]|uniref:GntR family transcriptional regulator n=1 Tax=Methylobacterium sp. J-076 TaxID=2836655 RepID=UPI001FBA4C56|nr:GntR family transcriptional regulator [Methylobacterium sp. J-076]MCJ2013653.1 GntR family transcriptional regulator [Methylobacterium sp. J-076]
MTQPIAQALSARLRDMILAGEFRGGQHLREVQLAQMFGASRTPVRLALAASEKDGLLEYSPNRGYVVRPFETKDIASAFEMRALIEGLAARKAAERGLSAEALGRIAAAIDQVDALLSTEAALDDAAREAWRTHNAVFHRAIIAGADNRFIAPTLETVQRIPSVYPPILASYDPALLRKYNDHHRGIRDCIAGRQGVRAEYLMREHVFLAGEEICASLSPARAHGIAPDALS